MTADPRPPLDVIYIAGYGRSGSTLVERILGELPDVAAMGEVRHLWRRGLVENHRCGCGRSFHACPFWGEVLDRSLGRPNPDEARAIAAEARRVDRTRHVPALLLGRGTPAWTVALDRHVGRLGALVGAVAEVAGRRWLVDASKEASHGFVLSRASGVRVHVLHLIRDPRGVAHSWTRAKRRRDVEGRETFMARRSPALTAWRWSYQNLAAEALGRHTGSYVRLRYEDVVAAPAEALRSALATFGYGGDARFAHVRGGTVRVGASHGVAGNPDRFDDAPIRLRADQAWRGEMRRRDVRVVTALTAPLLLRYGYPLAVDPADGAEG